MLTLRTITISEQRTFVGVGCPAPFITTFAWVNMPRAKVSKRGRRITELGVLLSESKVCKKCKLRHVPFTFHNIIGKLQKGLAGYSYVVSRLWSLKHGTIWTDPQGEDDAGPMFCSEYKAGQCYFCFFICVHQSMIPQVDAHFVLEIKIK